MRRRWVRVYSCLPTHCEGTGCTRSSHTPPAYAHTRAPACARARTHTHMHICLPYVCIPVHMYTYQIRIHASKGGEAGPSWPIQTPTQSHIHPPTYTYSHTPTHIHIQSYTHPHTHTHTCTYVYAMHKQASKEGEEAGGSGLTQAHIRTYVDMTGRSVNQPVGQSVYGRAFHPGAGTIRGRGVHGGSLSSDEGQSPASQPVSPRSLILDF